MVQVAHQGPSDMIVGVGSRDGSPQRSSTMVRVLTAMSWCGRSSKLWHKNSNMDSRRPNSASNRVMPTDPSAEVASSDKENVRPSPVDVVNRSDEMTDAFQLFCPICMYYYAETLKTKCCHHHICTNCTSEMIWRQGGTCTGSLPDSQIAQISCPHCSNEVLKVSRISGSDNYRRYEDSPAFTKTAPRTAGLGANGSGSVAPSPLKIGDTYENMMKKMLTYDQCGINIRASNATIVTSTPGRSPTPPPDGADASFPLPGAPFPPLPEDGSLSQRANNDDERQNSSRTDAPAAPLSTSSSRATTPRALPAADDENFNPQQQQQQQQARSLSSMSLPPELQRPNVQPPIGRPPRAVITGMEGILRPSNGSRNGSRAASPSLAERHNRASSSPIPSPLSASTGRSVAQVPQLPPLGSPASLVGRIQSPGRALVYMVDPADAVSPRDDTPRGEETDAIIQVA